MTDAMQFRYMLTASMLAISGCADRQVPLPIAQPQAPPAAAEEMASDRQVRTTILSGESPPQLPRMNAASGRKTGNVTVNLPSADLRTIARTIEALTGKPIVINNDIEAKLSFVTPGAVSRTALLAQFEEVLRAANLAMIPQAEGFVVRSVTAAQQPVSADVPGFGAEVITLKFINPDELRKLLDGVLPGVVTTTDVNQNTLTVTGTTGQRKSARDLVQQFDVNWLRNMSFALFIPERTDSRLIVRELEKLLNAKDAPTQNLVRLIAMERLNGVLAVTAQRQYLDDVQRWIEVLDREGESAEPRIFVYRVQNGRARDLAGTLNKALGSGGGQDDIDEPDAATGVGRGAADGERPVTGETNLSRRAGGPSGNNSADQNVAGDARGTHAKITADDINNAVVIYGTPRDYAKVEEALRKLDVAPYQVLIEAAITEVTLTDTLRYGVQWNWLTGNSNFTLTQGNTAAPTRIFPGFSYYLAGSDIDAALNALEKRTNINVVSAPKLVVRNNQTAALQVGDQVPVSVGNAVSVQDPDAPIVNSIEYRDTGVILKVTPRVNAGGLVLLDVSQEVSDVNPSPASTASSTATSPTISTRRISTSVAVQDGQVIALGGLFRDSKSFGKNGIPFLSRIPVLGGLFGDHNNIQNRTELIVLLKPRVIRTPDDGRAVTEELRAKVRTLEPFRTKGVIP